MMICPTIEIALIAVVLSEATSPTVNQFGHAIDANEQRIVVAWKVGNSDRDRVDMFVPTGKVWKHAGDVTPPGPPIDGDEEFIRLSGDGLLVADTEWQDGIGCVYQCLDLQGRAARRKWTTLEPSEMVREGHFGTLMARGPQTLAIVARHTAVPEAPSGVVYIFRQQQSGSSEIQKITADYPQADPLSFGESVALDEHLLAIGAPGAAIPSNKHAGVVFLYVPGPDGQFIPASPPLLSVSNDWPSFGLGVRTAMNKDWLIVTAYDAKAGTDMAQGAVFAWRRDEFGQVGERPTLQLVDPHDEKDNFGRSVALSDSVLCIGSSHHAVDGVTRAGTVYVYSFGENGELPGAPSQRLIAPRPSPSSLFGRSVAISGETIVISAKGEQNNRGAVYLFEPDKEEYSAAFRLSPTGGIESLKRRRSR